MFTALHRHAAGISLVAILLGASASAVAQSINGAVDYECTYGDCENGRGTLEFRTQFGKGEYVGEFRGGEFHGQGRLEVPISYTQREVYAGDWSSGTREGRGTHWNGKGDLYIGQWRNNKREGIGTLAYNLPEWHENQHTEFWLKDNTENYTGEWVNDHYQGHGTFRWASGAKYVGGFFASDKHGLGTFYYEKTGTARQQLWNYGDFIR